MNTIANIMVVESDGIVSRDIVKTLEKLGYAVLATASEGEEAIRQSEKFRLDLLLIDIMLDGKMDGIEAAAKIYSSFNIPVVFFTSTLDKKTIKRAKKIEPYGIIVKPFEERILQATIETALYRCNMERRGTAKKESDADVKNDKRLKENPEDWIRATFIIKKEYSEKIKAQAYWERKMIKDILDDALRDYFKNRKNEFVRKQGK